MYVLSICCDGPMFRLRGVATGICDMFTMVNLSGFRFTDSSYEAELLQQWIAAQLYYCNIPLVKKKSQIVHS